MFAVFEVLSVGDLIFSGIRAKGGNGCAVVEAAIVADPVFYS